MRVNPVIIVLVVTLLLGCAKKVSSIKQDIDIIQNSSTGYLLVGIESNIGLESIFIEGKKSIRLSREDLQRGTNYFLIEMPEGKYNFDKIKTSRWSRVELTDGYWGFAVESDIISYIGHLRVESMGFWSRKLNFELENRSSEALAFMENSFPNILSNRKIRYHGPGDDAFFEKMEELNDLEVVR